MNTLQEALTNVIVHLSTITDIDKFRDDLLYGFRNYVRRFALASDEYSVTASAFFVISARDRSTPFRRSWKNKSGSGRKYDIKYDHAVPAKWVCTEILKHRGDALEIRNILERTSHIVILTPQENAKLDAEYKDTMPTADWNYAIDDAFARYNAVGIEVKAHERIGMCGALAV